MKIKVKNWNMLNRLDKITAGKHALTADAPTRRSVLKKLCRGV
jgi:hypothetical protein